jgi:hypothetical protein
MTGSQTGSQQPARVHRLGLTVLVVLTATVLPATVHLLAPGADPGRILLGITGAERVQEAGTAVGDVRQPRPVAHRQIGGVRRPPASCDSSYCPAMG